MEGHEQAGHRSGPNGLRITLLGGFGVGVGANPVPDEAWRRRKPAALLKILALAPGYRVHRERLMDLLWPELELAAAGANLRKAIHQARSALDGVSRGAARLIEFQNDVVALACDGLVIDTASFMSELTAARRSGDADGYRSALARYGGDLLPDDPYEEWADAARRELHDAYAGGLSEWCVLLEANGDIQGAIEAARTLVAAEPTREESHAFLMRLYGLAGRRSDALRQYDYLSEILDHELGIEPSAQLQRLREEINARRSEEPSSPPNCGSRSATCGSWPATAPARPRLSPGLSPQTGQTRRPVSSANAPRPGSCSTGLTWRPPMWKRLRAIAPNTPRRAGSSASARFWPGRRGRYRRPGSSPNRPGASPRSAAPPTTWRPQARR